MPENFLLYSQKCVMPPNCTRYLTSVMGYTASPKVQDTIVLKFDIAIICFWFLPTYYRLYGENDLFQSNFKNLY